MPHPKDVRGSEVLAIRLWEIHSKNIVFYWKTMFLLVFWCIFGAICVVDVKETCHGIGRDAVLTLRNHAHNQLVVTFGTESTASVQS